MALRLTRGHRIPHEQPHAPPHPNVPEPVSYVTPPTTQEPPLCDIPSGRCFLTGPWTLTRSSLRMLRRVAAFCRPLRPVLLLVLFPRSRSPVVGVPGLCWMWRDVPFARQRRPIVAPPPPPPPAVGYRRVCRTGTVRPRAEVQNKSQRETLFSDISHEENSPHPPTGDPAHGTHTANLFGDGADVVEGGVTVITPEQPGHLPGGQEVVDVLQEALLLDLVVREDERDPALHGLEVLGPQVIKEIVDTVGLRDGDLRSRTDGADGTDSSTALPPASATEIVCVGMSPTGACHGHSWFLLSSYVNWADITEWPTEQGRLPG